MEVESRRLPTVLKFSFKIFFLRELKGGGMHEF